MTPSWLPVGLWFPDAAPPGLVWVAAAVSPWGSSTGGVPSRAGGRGRGAASGLGRGGAGARGGAEAGESPGVACGRRSRREGGVCVFAVVVCRHSARFLSQHKKKGLPPKQIPPTRCPGLAAAPEAVGIASWENSLPPKRNLPSVQI